MEALRLVGDKIGKLLRQHHFTLIRQDKHLVWQSREGRIFVCSKTPSDWRAERNMITQFNRIISTAPVPMVLAISDFERQEAAEKIAGQERQQQARAGMGSRKQRRSNGTGYKYYEPILTEEEIAQRKLVAEKARENHEQRRQRKLQRKADLQAKRDEAQKQILLERINEILAETMPPPHFLVTARICSDAQDFDEERLLFEATVAQFAESFELLEWKETDENIDVSVGDGTLEIVMMCTDLRKQSYAKTFNETAFPDGTQTADITELPNGTKRFNIKMLPDGTQIAERVEFVDAEGTVWFNETTSPNGDIEIEREEKKSPETGKAGPNETHRPAPAHLLPSPDTNISPRRKPTSRELQLQLAMRNRDSD